MKSRTSCRMHCARELSASVCHVLAEALSDEALNWLWLALPPDLARLLERPAAGIPSQPAAGSTLASGQPGSHHPIVDVPG